MRTHAHVQMYVHIRVYVFYTIKQASKLKIRLYSTATKTAAEAGGGLL